MIRPNNVQEVALHLSLHTQQNLSFWYLYNVSMFGRDICVCLMQFGHNTSSITPKHHSQPCYVSQISTSCFVWQLWLTGSGSSSAHQQQFSILEDAFLPITVGTLTDMYMCNFSYDRSSTSVHSHRVVMIFTRPDLCSPDVPKTLQQ